MSRPLVFSASGFARVPRLRAFSLVEVVVAVGIFAIAIVSIIGLMIPINKSVSEIGEGDDAARMAGLIIEELQKTGFTSVKSYIDGPPPTTATRLYASRDGKRIGTTSASAWDPDNSIPDAAGERALQFFEINLARNITLSPTPAGDANSAFLAYFLELRWPAHTGLGEPIGDRNQQSVLLVPAVVNR